MNAEEAAKYLCRKLRAAGYVRTHKSISGSLYYENNGNCVRISNHRLPENPEKTNRQSDGIVLVDCEYSTTELDALLVEADVDLIATESVATLKKRLKRLSSQTETGYLVWVDATYLPDIGKLWRKPMVSATSKGESLRSEIELVEKTIAWEKENPGKSTQNLADQEARYARLRAQNATAASVKE